MRLDVSGLTTRLSDEIIRQGREVGGWPDRTIVDLAKDLLAREPDRVFMIEGDTELTVREIWDQATALSSALTGRGLKQGDVIAMLLPNWAETIVVYLAASMNGLILNPVLPILRDSEVRFILQDSRSRLLFVARSFRNFDYVEMIDRIASDLPDLDTVVVLRGDKGKHTGWEEFSATSDTKPALPEVDPNSIKIIMYTSGTTGRPKGVMHTHNTLQVEIISYINYWGITADDVIFMASPVSHVTGCLAAFELSWASDARVVLQEKWDATEAVDLFRRHHVTFTSSSTPFLRELLSASQSLDERLPAFRRFVCGGMTIPPQLIRDAHDWFPNAVVGRCYGLSEVPSITLAIADRDQIDLGADTDGIIAPGLEVRIVDPETGALLPPGREGEIVVRAPEQFVGYYRPDDNEKAFDDDGFFRTGDIAILSEGNTLTVTGRKKDLIIRGGENLSAKEIEDALLAHPVVTEVAVVAMPHERLGEGVSCFIVPADGQEIDQAAVSAFLIKTGLSKQKIPERVELVDELPRNFQGKILKNVLRDRMRELCSA